MSPPTIERIPVPNPSPPVGIPGDLVLPALSQKPASGVMCWFRSLRIPQPAPFFAHWNQFTVEYKRRGFGVRKDNDQWFLFQWLAGRPGQYYLTPTGADILARAQALAGAPTTPATTFAALPEELEKRLWEYQRQPARQLLRALRHGNAEWGYPGAVDLSDMGTGKAQPIDSAVFTPDGPVEIGRLRVGDRVISVDGTATKVVGVFPQGVKPVYRVRFSDDSTTRCCGEHLWSVITPTQKLRGGSGSVITTKDLMGLPLRDGAGNSRFFIPIAEPAQHTPHTELIDSYVLGFLIGDGCFRGGTPGFSTQDQEIVERVAQNLPPEVKVAQRSKYDYAIISRNGKGGVNPVTRSLKAMGLWGKKAHDKRIPRQYLFGSVEQRKALLFGLMDSDGAVSGRGSGEFSTTSQGLAEDVILLTQSLGGTATQQKRKTKYSHKGEMREGRLSFRVYVRLPFAPFWLERKRDACQQRSKYFPTRAIVSIEPDGNAECVCIAVEHSSRLYLTDHYIVTHNTYMALAAALATGRKVVVICPPVGRPGWERAFAHFGAEPHFISTYEAVRGGWRPQVATVAGDGFAWTNPSEIILILDEAQALRHDDTLTVRCFSAAVRQGIPIIMASATIAVSPLEFRFAGRITGLHHGAHDWPRFLVAHGCQRKPGSETWTWPGGLHHLRDIHAELFPRRGCRVRKETLGDACPETEINLLPVQTEDALEIEQHWLDARDIVDRMRRQREPQFRITSLERTARMKIWQRCENSLVPHVAALAKRDLANGRSVALFLNFNESRQALGRLLNTSDGFYGGQPPRRRKQLEDAFQANRIRVLVSNIGAGGASVSLHDLTGEFPRIAYIFPTDNVVQMVQATGRIDRVGGRSRSIQWIPFVAGTMTERMVARTLRKMGAINTLNDGATNHGACNQPWQWRTNRSVAR